MAGDTPGDSVAEKEGYIWCPSDKHTSGVCLASCLHCLSDEWLPVGISLWIYRWRKWVRAYIWVGSAMLRRQHQHRWDKNSIPPAASSGSLQGPAALPPMPRTCSSTSTLLLDTHTLVTDDLCLPKRTGGLR